MRPFQPRNLHALLVALGPCLLGVNAYHHDRAFYLGFEAGFAKASTLEPALFAINHPTRYDSLLHADPGMAPSSDAEFRNNTSKLLFANSYDFGGAFTGGLSLSYDLGKFTFEPE